jgi:hypothetical protein
MPQVTHPLPEKVTYSTLSSIDRGSPTLSPIPDGLTTAFSGAGGGFEPALDCSMRILCSNLRDQPLTSTTLHSAE